MFYVASWHYLLCRSWSHREYTIYVSRRWLLAESSPLLAAGNTTYSLILIKHLLLFLSFILLCRNCKFYNNIAGIHILRRPRFYNHNTFSELENLEFRIILNSSEYIWISIYNCTLSPLIILKADASHGSPIYTPREMSSLAISRVS
jgi:hypothetical protein